MALPPENKPEHLARAFFRAIVIALAWTALGLGWLWALLALWYLGPWPVWTRVLMVLIWGAFVFSATVLLPRPSKYAARRVP